MDRIAGKPARSEAIDALNAITVGAGASVLELYG
jgi:hypothetical protein